MNQSIKLAQAPRTYDFESDSAGDWNMIVANDLSAGAHIVSVEDEQGNIDQAIMYVVKDKSELESIQTEPIIIEKINTIMPDYLAWPFAGLTAVIAFLSICMIVLASKASLRERTTLQFGGTTPLSGEKPRINHYLRYALIICVLAWLSTSVIGIILSRKTNFLSGLFDNQPKITAIEELSGQVLHPLDKTGVSGIDLSYSNTSIRTSGSGHYIFNNIAVGDGIKATHNELLKALVFLPEATQNKELMNILFEVNLFNNVIRVIDAEARGRYGDIYWSYVSPKIRSKIAENGYVADYQSGKVKPENVNDQELVVKSVVVTDKLNVNKYGLTLDKAVVITILINGQELIYPWEIEDGNWYLLN